ncbi:MAG TPA: hypothetical protein VFX41_06145 [Actinomycetales bacterium]|nr:hypothetical protein [Actinomycetales bacterium]
MGSGHDFSLRAGSAGTGGAPHGLEGADAPHAGAADSAGEPGCRRAAEQQGLEHVGQAGEQEPGRRGVLQGAGSPALRGDLTLLADEQQDLCLP